MNGTELALTAIASAIIGLCFYLARISSAAISLKGVAQGLYNLVESRTSNEGATDPATLERLEAVERRVTLALEDLQKQHRKVAQERRRIEKNLELDGIDPDELELAESLQRGLPLPPGSRIPSSGSDGKRPRLRKR